VVEAKVPEDVLAIERNVAVARRAGGQRQD
jgi:hypothetical protein